ncbi:hypothetical protein XPA_001951 [Xanthoria parietina]
MVFHSSINRQTITKVAMSQTLKHATPVSRHSWDVATLVMPITKVVMSQTLKHATPVSRHFWDVATLVMPITAG